MTLREYRPGPGPCPFPGRGPDVLPVILSATAVTACAGLLSWLFSPASPDASRVWIFLLPAASVIAVWWIEAVLSSLDIHRSLAGAHRSIHWKISLEYTVVLNALTQAGFSRDSALTTAAIHCRGQWGVDPELPVTAGPHPTIRKVAGLLPSIAVILYTATLHGRPSLIGLCPAVPVLVLTILHARHQWLSPGAFRIRLPALTALIAEIGILIGVSLWSGHPSILPPLVLIHLLCRSGTPWRGCGSREALVFLYLNQNPDPAISAMGAGVIMIASAAMSAGWAAAIITAAPLLRRWTRYSTEAQSRSFPSAAPSVSVIIPARNEEAEIGETIRRIQSSGAVREILVADGQSTDSTAAIARSHGCHVLSCPPSRGAQMRLAATRAEGEILFFCHADTHVEPDFVDAVRRCLRDPEVLWGGLWKRFRDPSPWMAGSRFRCWLQWMLFGRVFGDQCIFIRRDALIAVGGFPEAPLMEEFHLARKLRSRGKMALADSCVRTSTRKFRKLGILRTYWRMTIVTALFYLGVAPEKLEAIYRRP